jgi:hypothetical protein
VGFCLVIGMFILVGLISKIIPSGDQYVNFKLKFDEKSQNMLVWFIKIIFAQRFAHFAKVW